MFTACFALVEDLAPTVQGNTPNWVDVGSFCISIITLIVLFFNLKILWKYTKETEIIAKASITQIKNSIRPIVILEFKDPTLTTEWKPVMRNLGNGPAFNVKVSPLSCGKFSTEFQMVPILEEGIQLSANAKTLQDNIFHNIASTEGNYFKEMLFVELNEQLTHYPACHPLKEFPVSISYSDATENRYQSQLTLHIEGIPGNSNLNAYFAFLKNLPY